MNVFATSNSSAYSRPVAGVVRLVMALGLGLILLPAGVAGRDANSTERGRFVARVQTVFAVAQKRFELEPTNNVAAWEFARAGFDRAEYATNDAERATLAIQCIAACRPLLGRAPESAAAHYYLGMNLGQLARTKLLGAFKIVDEMEREFKAALTLDERFDHAGPDRNLGRLYFEAPVIGSVGSRAKARKHLQRAAEVAPGYPENRLNLAEAFLKWREKKNMQRELDLLEKLWPTARTQFTGEDWEEEWLDWQRRYDKLRRSAVH